jgi:hypothetical protein
LPNVERMPLATLQKLDEFTRQGGVVIAARRKPASLPGYNASEAERSQFNALAQALFEGEKPRAHFVADEQQLGAKLAALTQPDVRLAPAVPGIGFIHRRTPEADIYFLANSTNETQRINATFRVTAAQAELWNPLEGSVAPVQVELAEQGATVALSFAPYESRVLVFTRRHLPAPAPSLLSALPTPPSPLDISKDWRVTIGQTSKTVEQLRSWTEDAATRFYSGTATYEKEINVPVRFLQAGVSVRVDFGTSQAVPVTSRKNGLRAWLDAPVRDAAVIYVNDERAGSAWCPPYTLDITKLLKPGANRLRIVVGNTAINHLAGTKLPDYRELNQRYGERFQPQDMENLQPLPSGLLGTIRLVAQ